MSAELNSIQDSYLFTTSQRRLLAREQEAGILPADQLVNTSIRQQQYDRLESMIGHTPLLRIYGPKNTLLLAKDESQNPTGSHYDRVYVPTLRRLEEEGIIQPGDNLYEVTSGSAGIAFAWACSRLGYNANIFVPARIPQARKQEMVNFGARLVPVVEGYVPEASAEEWKQFSGLVRQRRYKLAKHETNDFSIITAVGKNDKGEEERMCLMNHSENPLTPKLLESIGREVSEIIPRGVGIDYFVSVLGNGSNTSGVTAGLIERWKRLQVVGVEDFDNPVQFEAKYPGEYERRYGHVPTYKPQQMFGSSAKGTKLRFMNIGMLADIRLVADAVWQQRMDDYNSGRPAVETIGASSAGAWIVAEEVATENPGSNILLLRYDKRDRYGEPEEAIHIKGATIFASDPKIERARTQPLDYRQKLAEVPNDLPASLWEAYHA
ncbi:MAG TPA: pyridoxal-phosphate dependent enzyme [Patescibacteria group bacterium]|nr:pyridoxal-phosphate dependent enzyme [Patescibacteria group bacterium]